MSLGDRGVRDREQDGGVVQPERNGNIMVGDDMTRWVRIWMICVGVVTVHTLIWMIANGMPFLLGFFVLLMSTIVILFIAISLPSRSPKSETPSARMCTAQDLDLLTGVLSDHPSNMGPEWRCTICLCDSHGDGQQLRELGSCKHVFHRDCIDQWFLDTPLFSLKCPLCRGPVFKPQTPEIDPSPASAGRSNSLD